MSVASLSSPTPLLGLGARSLDDRSLVDLLGLLPKELVEQVLIVVRTSNSADSCALPRTIGTFPLIQPTAIGAGAQIQLPLHGVLHLPAGWTVDHDTRHWWLSGPNKCPNKGAGNDGAANRRAARRDAWGGRTMIDRANDPLDPFFREIARVAGQQGVGLLASACVPAGIHGLRTLADAGGLTLVENPSGSRPAADAAPGGTTCHRGSIAGLAAELQEHLQHLQGSPAQRDDEGVRSDSKLDNSELVVSGRAEQLERELRKMRAKMERMAQELDAAKEEAKAAREQQQLALDSVSHGTWNWHIPSGRIEFSSQWLERFGYDASDGPHDVEFWNSIVHPDDLQARQQAIDAHLDGTSEIVAVEKRLRTANGQYHWYLARGRVVERDAQGRPVRMVGIDTNISERKAAERARREAERRTQLAVEAGGLGYWHWEIGTDHVLYSRRERELLGLPPEGPVALADFWERVHPDDRQRLQQYHRRVIASDAPYEAEFRVVHPDGAVYWLAGKGDKTYDEETQRRLLIGMHWDITERRQSEQRLRRVVDTAQVGIAFARADGRIVECNESLLKTLGYDRETFEREGLNWKDADLPIEAMIQYRDSPSTSRLSADDSVGTAMVGQLEIPLARRDGSRVETLCSVRQLEEGGDEFVTFVVDLTPLKTAEEQLRRSEDQLRWAAEGAGFGMYEIDFSTGHITWSPEMRKLLGVATDAEVPTRGKLIADFIHPDDRQEADTALTKSLDPAGGGSLQHEYRILRPDGSIRWLLVRGSTVFGGEPHKRPLRSTGIVLDVTDRKRVEQSLVQAQSEAEAASRSKSEFLANMSHEIRTPMTAILGYADLVAEQLSDPVALEQIETIRRNGRFLLNIINDILDLSKIDAGRLEVRCEPCQVGQLVTDVCALMEVRVREKNLQLVVDFEGQIPQTINTDPTRLRQVLVNLIGNAIKFTDEGSIEVVVRHDESEQRLQIDVIDTGIGIAEDAQAELFAPFMQADTAINRQFGGTGLGLAITRRLAEMLGGEVTVSSTLGEGSCFTVSIATGPLDGVPRVSPVLQIPSAPPPARGAGRVDSRILVVDDSRDIRALASTLLKRAGADVTTAEGGQQAIDAVALAEAEGRPFELIFMDVQMPGMDGPTAVSRLRASGYTVPVVALTANAMQGDREKCLRQGYTDYLSKPLDIRHFSATLKKHLHR